MPPCWYWLCARLPNGCSTYITNKSPRQIEKNILQIRQWRFWKAKSLPKCDIQWKNTSFLLRDILLCPESLWTSNYSGNRALASSVWSGSSVGLIKDGSIGPMKGFTQGVQEELRVAGRGRILSADPFPQSTEQTECHSEMLSKS